MKAPDSGQTISSVLGMLWPNAAGANRRDTRTAAADLALSLTGMARIGASPSFGAWNVTQNPPRTLCSRTASAGVAGVSDGARNALGRLLDEGRPRGLHALGRRRHGQSRHERPGVV